MTNTKTLRGIAHSMGLALALYGLEGRCAGPMFMPSEDVLQRLLIAEGGGGGRHGGSRHGFSPKPPMPPPSAVRPPPVRPNDAAQQAQALQHLRDTINAKPGNRQCCRFTLERLNPGAAPSVPEYRPGYSSGEEVLKGLGVDVTTGREASSVDLQTLTQPGAIAVQDPATGKITHMVPVVRDPKTGKMHIEQSYDADPTGTYHFKTEFKTMDDFLDKDKNKLPGGRTNKLQDMDVIFYPVPPSPTSTGPSPTSTGP